MRIFFKSVIDKILKPNLYALILFSLFSLFFLTFYIWWFSFTWEFIASIAEFIIALFIVLIIGLRITTFMDKRMNWKLSYYIRIAIIQLLFLWGISNPVRNWQIKKSKNRASIIIENLEKYKQEFNYYPSNLDIINNRYEIRLPVRTLLGTRYWYEVKEPKQDSSLSFYSYYGYIAYYNVKNHKWVFTD